LNRYWIKREIDEGRNDIYDIYTLSLVTWKRHMFEMVHEKIMHAVLSLVSRERRGEDAETGLIKLAIESFVTLGLDEHDASRSSLDVYVKYFEEPFVEATEKFYKEESARHLAENPVTDYMKKAQTRLKEEEERVEHYLHPHTRDVLMSRCDAVLVKDHSDVIHEEFQNLIEDQRLEDLSRMYFLLSRVADGLVPLREKFETHVRKVGSAAVDKLAEQNVDTLEPKVYVDTLLEVHSKFHHIVTSAFASEAGFTASLDRACREIVNRNKICKAAPMKSSEFLARFCDGVLKKGAKNAEEEELEAILNNVMTIFKYIEDKDVFQKFYSKLLAKRLIQQSSASEDAESSMIGKLKDASGYEYTSKLSRMFTDIRLSKDINDEFKERTQATLGDESKIDFYVMVLTQGQWPLNFPSNNFTIPQELLKLYERFQRFYQNKHSGRVLKWLPQHSKGELRATYFKHSKTGYTFQVSMYQMAILLLFNDAMSLSFQELLTRTALEKETLSGPLGILVKTKVLTAHDNGQPTELVGSPDSTYALNMDFKNKKMRINLNLPVRTEQKKETEETHRAIEEDRSYVIQAMIVRIMKTRKVMKHVALVDETITQLQAKFRPEVRDIKKSIDVLMEKEYIERVDGQKDMLSYIA
jgi:cullin 1